MTFKISEFIKKYSLLFTVFITGGCILVIEVLATRILSPYFGNTIFTVSSVISVVLLALSIGYYIGGNLADKNPSEKLFYSIILASGLSVFLIYFLNIYFLPEAGYGFSIISGPIIFSFILFFFPSLLMGTLSPFAIKLQEMRFPKAGIGGISGKVFFYSTVGSIFGSLSTGFLLIPYFGVRNIIFYVAILLSLLGIIPLFKMGFDKKRIVKMCLLIAFLSVLSILGGYFLPDNKKNVYSKDGVYEKILIYDDIYQDKETRFFIQDMSNSGAMFLGSPELVFDYTKYYSIYKVFSPNAKKSLVIGGGAYSIPKVLLNESQDMQVDVCEIEPSLFELGKKYFDVKDDIRLNNYIQDGRRFLHDTNNKYDLIFSDVYYSLYSIPSHFTTQEFFRIAKDKMNKDGVFIANIIGDLSRESPSLILSEINTFKSVFPNSYYFATNSPYSLEAQNIIFVGYNSDKIIDLNSKEIKDSQIDIIKNLSNKLINIDVYNLSLYSVLTDDFAPVDNFTAKAIKKATEGNISRIYGNEMLAIINQQLSYGPRFLGSDGHQKTQDFLIEQMNYLTESVKVQKWVDDKEMVNIVASFFPDKTNRIILATHYDSKKFANLDFFKPNSPVPGANDSASGVAVLLEIARYLKESKDKPSVGVDIIFFDGEEGETNVDKNFTNWKPLGSNYFSLNIKEIYPKEKPSQALVLDLVCAKGMEILKEQISVKNAKEQVDAFWEIAKKNKSNIFKQKIGKEISDDHTALNSIGIPSFLVIGDNYSYFHTTQDTIDKCSYRNLQVVGETVLNYIYSLK